MENTKKFTAKRIISIVVNIILYLFFALCLCALIFSLAAKKDSDGAVSLFGKQMRVVISPSMEKCDQTDVSAYKIKDIPVKSMVFIELVPEDEQKASDWYAGLQVGDVLTFRYVYTSQETITHRIIGISENTRGGYTIQLAGDNKSDSSGVLTQTIDTSQTDSPNYVIGKVTGQSPALGWIIYSLRQPVGLVLIIIIPCAIIIILQVIRIIEAVNSDKKKKEAEAREKQNDEIEALKRQLADLQNSKTDDLASETAQAVQEGQTESD